MNTKQTLRERISAFTDGELSADQATALLRDAAHNEVLKEWDLYHSIGDVLRSDDIPGAMSKDFSAKFAARFAQEATIVAPDAAVALGAKAQSGFKIRNAPRRWMLPGVAAAVAVIVTTLTAPQIMTAVQTGPASTVSAEASVVSVELADAGLEVLRDPRIDDYLLAHQQFSPSLYNSAHYVRSATFASDSSK
jgi:sigma-E factor negative regulatory protein RseA